MLHPVQKQLYQKRFAVIESSFRVEGMDPSGDAIYETAKNGILSGELTPKQALSFVVQRSAKPQKSRSKGALVNA
jgi:hypothetical protein